MEFVNKYIKDLVKINAEVRAGLKRQDTEIIEFIKVIMSCDLAFRNRFFLIQTHPGLRSYLNVLNLPIIAYVKSGNLTNCTLQISHRKKQGSVAKNHQDLILSLLNTKRFAVKSLKQKAQACDFEKDYRLAIDFVFSKMNKTKTKIETITLCHHHDIVMKNMVHPPFQQRRKDEVEQITAGRQITAPGLSTVSLRADPEILYDVAVHFLVKDQ